MKWYITNGKIHREDTQEISLDPILDGTRYGSDYEDVGQCVEYPDDAGEICIPEGVTSIGEYAFRGCRALTSVTIPDSVTSIGNFAFCGCSSLKSVAIPDSVKKIGIFAFECENLEEIQWGPNGCKITHWMFGFSLPRKLTPYAKQLAFRMNVAALLDYIVWSDIWDTINMRDRVTLLLNNPGKQLMEEYNKKGQDWHATIGIILERLTEQSSAGICNAVAKLMVTMHSDCSNDDLQALYQKLLTIKSAKSALKTIEDSSVLSKRLNIQLQIDESLVGSVRKIAEYAAAQGQTLKELEDSLRNFYGISAADLPQLQYKNGRKVEPMVFTWLLTTHEQMAFHPYSGNYDVVSSYEKAGLRPEAAEIASELDPESFQKALRTMAKRNLGIAGRSKKMFLAYPICRYADAELMKEQIKAAPSWRSKVSGNDAPPLYTFRQAVIYSEAREAMFFADKYKGLDRYAKIRNTNEDNIRDQFLSDVGLDAKGGKVYDLGGQRVTARLQSDLSFLVELENGKMAKSLPKKGADAEKHAAANADFAEMKKNAKLIVKNRASLLFKEFLSGRGRRADEWQSAYLNNPLLRRVASLLVWTQNGRTFTLSDEGPIAADGSAYEILDDPMIALAHPMEMDEEDLAGWKKYFISHNLKQPFEQIWEPYVAPDSVRMDRYKDCMIPYYRFVGQEKRGITVEDRDFHYEISITMNGCNIEVDRIDGGRHELKMDDRFEVTSFRFDQYSRQVNHIVAYLDRITAYDRVRKDDISVVEVLPRFTQAQLAEFIDIAIENQCVNVTAALLDYKKRNYAEEDFMSAFTLE